MKIMCSGEYLESRVQNFCKDNTKDEGDIWQIINNIHIKVYGRNIIWEKQEYEKNNNIHEDIPLSQYFAWNIIVHHAILIIQGLEECIINNWALE